MGEQRRKNDAKEAARPKAPDLHDGLSKCLESGHKTCATFAVEHKSGITKLHACSQCGLMFWE